MNFSLIICTYKRPKALLTLLQSVKKQTLYPNEILIVDGSPDDFTEEMLAQNHFLNLIYFKVDEKDRGLTKQRNFGILHVSDICEVVCFLDDDTVLMPYYFEKLINTYQSHPQALGVGGYISNLLSWQFVGSFYIPKIQEFYYDGYKLIDGFRFVLRKRLGLDSNVPPGFLPEFSHGRSVDFLPPSDRIYEVQQLMGGVSSFRKAIFKQFQFSTYFEGYGLYEDADFTLRVSKKGKLYINTAAQLEHHHDPSGRPNQFYYGKMVVRNGWYVWRIKYPNPSLNAILKWHIITHLLIVVRIVNIFTATKKIEAFTEVFGRIIGWLSLFWSSPKS